MSRCWDDNNVDTHMMKALFVVVDWHVPVSVDLSAAATTYNVMASGVLFHKGRRHHVCRNSRVDLGAAATGTMQ
jgi:hypothetical protein